MVSIISAKERYRPSQLLTTTAKEKYSPWQLLSTHSTRGIRQSLLLLCSYNRLFIMNVTDGKARKRSHQHTAISQCPQCDVSRDDFHNFNKPGQGLFSKHCSLCLGNDSIGNSRYFKKCLICHKDVSQMSFEAVYKHYQEKHNQLITQDRIIYHLHREVYSQDYLDLDSN